MRGNYYVPQNCCSCGSNIHIIINDNLPNKLFLLHHCRHHYHFHYDCNDINN